jgi:death-on-curing protein
VQNHALVDGNKRLGLTCVAVFYAVNGYRLEATNELAYELVMSIADGQRRDVAAIAPELARVVTPAPALEGGGRGRGAPR